MRLVPRLRLLVVLKWPDGRVRANLLQFLRELEEWE